MAKKRKRRRRRPNPGPAAAQPATAPREPTRRRTARDEPPPAPWGSFPLSELVVLTALVLLVVGFLSSGWRQPILIGAAVAIGGLAGLEIAVREHFAGYRSHILVLAAVPAIAVLGILFFAGLLPVIGRVAIALAVFLLAARALSEGFKKRSGGLPFRIRGWR